MMKQIELYFAPLEGVTDVWFRNIHARLFPNTCTRYFAPFFTPTKDNLLTQRDRFALSHENNHGCIPIPQIMGNDPELFLAAARELAAMGYDEVNLNLGCPSGTVVSKKRGAGFLSETDLLDSFFDTVFNDSLFSPPGVSARMRISVKTRLGMFSIDEFPDILAILNRYPIAELILHPRLRTEMYRGEIHSDMTAYTIQHTNHPLCCNGDLFSYADVLALQKQLPKMPHAFMLGRGAVANPNLFKEVRQALAGETVTTLTKNQLQQFSDAMLEDAKSRLSGERHVLFRMKELWSYWITLFEDADADRKRMKKATTLSEFCAATASLFARCPLSPNPTFSPDC